MPQRNAWYKTQLGLSALWRTTRGAGIRIAVLDSGIASVRGLDRSSVQNLSAQGRPRRDGDKVGHGTQCASVIGSTSPQLPGLCPAAEIIGIKVTSGESGTPNARALASGIRTAVELGCDVISCSLILRRMPTVLHEAVREAHLAGAVLVVAAGNRADVRSEFPEIARNVVVVGATTPAGRVVGGTRQGLWIDTFAPGKAIQTIDQRGRFVAAWTGTSPATAVAGGVIALALGHARGTRRKRAAAAMEGLIAASNRGDRRLDARRLCAAVKALP